ncbi:MAG TPA: ABC transporter permease [Conexivisphaerales archaeon]|nr:ABC transporter permease [Conexivisphaerales archaeon]
MKEIRDLIKDPKLLFGMIVVPLLMYPLMGAAINVSTQAVQNSIGTGNFAIMNLDGGNYSNMAVQYFTSIPKVTVNSVGPEDITSAIADAQRLNATSLVVIPQGFSQNVTDREEVHFDTYTPMKTFATTETAKAGVVSSIIDSFSSYLSDYYISTADPSLNATIAKQPLSVDAASVVNGQLVDISPSVLGNIILGQSFGTPIALMVVIILAMQIAATAIAVEKEQKTLETLLTLPVSRFNILSAKLIGSTVIAGLGAITTVIGFTYYMSSFSSSFASATSVSFNLTPPLLYYVILGALVFLTLAFATSLAIVIGVFCEDVRSAQAVVGYMIIPIMIPTFMLLFSDLQAFSLPIQAGLLLFPFSYATIFSKMSFVGDYTIGLMGIGYLVLWTVIVLYIGSRLFSSEKVLTAKFSFSRKKQQRQE